VVEGDGHLMVGGEKHRWLVVRNTEVLTEDEMVEENEMKQKANDHTDCLSLSLYLRYTHNSRLWTSLINKTNNSL
jgi:hypothetical protein